MSKPHAASDWNLTPPKPNKPLPERELLDERQAGALLGVSGRTVRNMANRGQIPRVRLLSNVRYHIDDLRAFIQHAKQTGKAASEGGAA